MGGPSKRRTVLSVNLNEEQWDVPCAIPVWVFEWIGLAHGDISRAEASVVVEKWAPCLRQFTLSDDPKKQEMYVWMLQEAVMALDHRSEQ